MKGIRRGILAVLLVVTLLAGTFLANTFNRPAQASTIGDILKIGGIVLVVSTFGSQINTFINNTLGQREAAAVGATKVVPIFSVGRGAYVGAAQVIGTPTDVRRVQAVAAVETEISRLTGSLVVPISTKSAKGTNLSRVGGVGVSAVIDFHI